MKMFGTVLSTVVLGLCLTAPALAADLQITVNTAEKTLTFTSLLATPVHVVGLESPAGYYGTSAELPAQGTDVAPLVGELPEGIEAARCLAGPDGLPGFDKTPEGFYLIPVEVQ